MRDQYISRLEEQLEKLIEGGFVHLFGKKITAHQIALELARTMEDNLRTGHQGDEERLTAPDRFVIYLNPTVQAQLIRKQPALPGMLSQHLVELATQSGYQMVTSPIVQFAASSDLETDAFRVHSSHTNRVESSTSVFQPVQVPPKRSRPNNAQLLIDGTRVIALEQNIINIGRSPDNEVVLDDVRVSRHHIQLRMRSGTYILFDVQSKGGTWVNNIMVREHHLQSGDVIRIGGTQIVYVEEGSAPPGTTQTMNRVEP